MPYFDMNEPSPGTVVKACGSANQFNGFAQEGRSAGCLIVQTRFLFDPMAEGETRILARSDPLRGHASSILARVTTQQAASVKASRRLRRRRP